ncbi:DUF1403 family protein [Methylocystis sp. H62]|uniref:DUF1403 family protein n=1 Tax=Methylocystis sp. H62 TaxID=2785789 RepID=UPI0018C27B21|nr:DUF1403 family protein [Methylocystis sp. H62]MBG0793172.1 DUF1403 family protein [Methylocystis sp. H62]
MLQIDSAAVLDAQSSSRAPKKRRALTRSDEAQNPRKPIEIQSLPRWARFEASARGDPESKAFVAGANLLALDQILRSGEARGEPCLAGVLRQRLALKAAATCARLARLREDEAALRDAEHLSGVGVETTPAGRIHRLFRLFAPSAVKLDAQTLSAALKHIGAQGALEAHRFVDALQEIVTNANEPLAVAAGVSAAAIHDLAEFPAIDAEILALWLADVALAQKLGWRSPMPLLATVIAYPALRLGQQGQRPRPGDRGWSDAQASAYALAARDAVDLAGALSRQTQKLLDAAPKLRAKGAERVVEMLLDDDCIAPARAAKMARLSDRGARRLFDRLTELGAVRELTGRANFRLYGL